MELPRYPISANKTISTYQFISEGPKGKFVKGVQFSKVSVFPDVYNLALGDVNPTNGQLDDQVITNNNDRDKILATVGSIVLDFCSNHKGANIMAVGNTSSKTRLYQMIISANLKEVQKKFIIYGLTEGKWEIFIKNRNYTALLAKTV